MTYFKPFASAVKFSLLLLRERERERERGGGGVGGKENKGDGR